MKLKAWVFLSIPLLFFSFVVLHRPIICLVFKHTLTRQFSDLKSAEFSYGHLGYNEGVIYLDDISFKDRKSSKTILSIEKVECHLLFNTPSHLLDTYYKIIRPTITWGEVSQKREWDIQQLLSMASLTKKLTIEEGTVICLREQEMSKIHLSFLPGKESSHIGSMTIGMDHPEGQRVHMSLDLRQEPKYLRMYLQWFDMPLVALNPFISLYSTSYRFQEGSLQGELLLSITPEGKLHQLKSDVALQEMILTREDSFVEVAECRLRNTLPQNHQDMIDLKNISLAPLMRYLVSTYEVEGGTISIKHPDTPSIWLFKELEGMFTCNLAHTPHLSVKGALQHQQTVYPFALEGKGLVESDQNWWMDIEIYPFSQESGIIESGRVPIYIALLDGKEHFVKATVHQLGISAINMIQDVGKAYFSCLQDIEVTAGSLSTDIMMRVQEGKIQALLLDAFTCSSFEGIWKNKDLKIKCSEMKGRVKLHFPLLMTMKAPVWDLSFQDLLVHNLVGEVVLESSGMISSKDWKVASSWMTTKCEGIVGEWSISGHYSELDVSGSLTFKDKHLFSCLQQEVLAAAPHVQRLTQMDCSFKIKYSPKKVHIAGVTNLGYTSSLVDKLRFGISVPTEELWEGVIEPEGWFQSDNLSEHTYLWFVKYYHQKWHALGSMRVTGELHKDAIRFTLEADQAVYDSEDIVVIMDPQLQQYHGDFLFDISKKRWLIHLPIRGVQCIDKRFHLPFKEVDADVKIEGMQLYAENLKAVCEEVLFEGRLELDFADPEWIDLKLYPSSIEAQAQDFLRFMRYLPDFKHLQIPFQGVVKGGSGNYLFTRYNLTESNSTSHIGLQIAEGIYECTKYCSIHQLSCGLIWDSSHDTLEIKELQGEVFLSREEEKGSYRLNAQNLMAKNLKEGLWEFDLRLEAPTFDVLRIAGSTSKTVEGWNIYIEPYISHFFGTKMEQIALRLDEQGGVKHLELGLDISLADMVRQIHFAYLTGFSTISPYFLQDLKHLKHEGVLSCQLSYLDSNMIIECKSEELLIGEMKLQSLQGRLLLQGKKWIVEQLATKDCTLTAELDEQEGRWTLSSLHGTYQGSSLTMTGGSYQEGLLALELDKLVLNLQEFHQMNIKNPMIAGLLHAQGRVFVDVAEGFKHMKVSSQLVVNSESLGDQGLDFTSKLPMKISYSCTEGLEIEHLNVHVQKKDLSEVWAVVEARYFSWHDHLTFAKGIKLTLPPEMVRYLVQTGWIPHVEYTNDQFRYFDKTFIWDNQLETEFNFSWDSRRLQVQGVAKDGYYWIGNKSVYFQDIHYFFDQDQLSLALGWDYQDISLDFLAKIHLKEGIDTVKDGMEARVIIKEGHGEEHDNRPSLEVACRYLSDEGLCLHSIQGSLYGVDFSFRRNSRAYLPNVTVLTGQMKIDTAGLVKAFPKLFYQTIKDLGMGSGYELSGDLVFSKEDVKSSYFKGFLKGRDFEFLGFYFKTLLSEVEINTTSVMINDFRLSDMSGVAHIKEASVKQDDEGFWQLQIPEIALQDFRPSFLKKQEGHEERIKPFVIKDLHFFDIQGTLGCKDSFSGVGHLDFINTFKRETNLLDLPIEIIGRIGFDLGLFVPVVGRIEFEMADGNIFLRELTDAYSEGKRSRFYLASHQDSYIGLDGSIVIDIKMKQYVLLKVTQPFTLSIRGTLIKPKYSLRSAR